MWGRCLFVGLLGCGRIGFDETDSSGSASATDAQGALDGTGQAWQFMFADGVSPNGAATAAVQLDSPTTTGQLIIVSANTGANMLLSSLTDDAGNTYVPVPTSRADSSSTNDTVVIWYAANVKAGATTVTATASEIWTFAVWQFNVPGPVSVDAAAGLSNQAGIKMPIAPSLITTHVGDIVVASAIVQGQITQIDPSYMLDSTANANGFGHLLDSRGPAGVYQATWTQQNATAYCSNAAAFAVGL